MLNQNYFINGTERYTGIQKSYPKRMREISVKEKKRHRGVEDVLVKGVKYRSAVRVQCVSMGEI